MPNVGVCCLKERLNMFTCFFSHRFFVRFAIFIDDRILVDHTEITHTNTDMVLVSVSESEIDISCPIVFVSFVHRFYWSFHRGHKD